MAPMEPQQSEGDIIPINLAKHSPMKMNMALLIDFMLQKTYHDLTVMAELLPRKSDIERKIAIIEFATKSRQQFVRLLALVKWAASAENVVKCQVISSILDHQSFIFIDTADNLSRMARETLVNSRLPAFSLPAAVDVLTTETYSRLPACIRDRIIPADPITGNEKIKTLKRLDQVIQQRLVTSKLPPQMSSLVIADGRVKFTVENEFEVELTLMGDDPVVPWRLLSVDFLVQDFKTGEGKMLVHGLQVQYIHQLAQSRLFTEESPLIDLYNCLHSFCSLLQLEVLHSQAQRLVRERWSESVKMENYVVGQKLTISYWRNPKHKKREKDIYIVSIVVGSEEQKCSLTLTHTPALKSKGKTKNVLVSTKRLCIETILNETIQAQSLTKLEVIEDLLKNDKSMEPLVSLDSKMPKLNIRTCVTSSVISVSVESRTGLYDVAISNCEVIKLCLTLKNSLNKDLKNFPGVLKDVRCSLRVQQCIKNVQNMATTSTSLSLVNFNDHALSQLSKHKLYMKFQMHSSYYLVLEVKIDEKMREFSEDYYLLKVKPATSTHPSVKESSEGSRRTSTTEKGEKQVEGFFLKAGPLVKLDSDFISDLTNITNDSAFLRVNDVLEHSSEKVDYVSVKRMKTDGESSASRYVPKVEEVYSICNARIPYLILCNEFNKAKIPYHEVYKDNVDLSVRILDLPTPINFDTKVVKQLKKNLLDCTVSHDTSNGNQWLFKLIMANPPFKHNQPNASQHVLLYYKSGTREETREEYSDKFVWSMFLDDWKSICRLYKHAKELDEYLVDSRCNLSYICSVHSFTYKELVIAYGYDPGFQNLVTVKWSVVEKSFTFSFSHIGGETSGHQHEMIRKVLQNEFAKHYNLPYVIQTLHETCAPFYSLSKLPTTLGMFRGLSISPAFAVLPQSSSCARLSFKDYYMLEFNFRSKQLVSVRDCAHYKLFLDKFQAPIQPIHNLKAFLQQYNDGHTEMAMKNAYALNWESLSTSLLANPALGPRFENTQRLPHATGYNEPRSGPISSSKHGLVPRLTTLSSLNFPVPSPAIPMSPTVTNFLTAPVSAASANTYIPAPSPASYFNAIPSPATPYQLITSPATPQTGVPSPAMLAPSPGNASWSPQAPSSNTHHQRIANQRMAMPAQPQAQSSSQQSQATHAIQARRISSWAAIRPLLISHACFDKIMTPTVVNAIGGHKVLVTPLEQFLSCHLLLIYFKKVIAPKFGKTLGHVRGGFSFKTSNLKLSVVLDASFTSLHLDVQPLQENLWSKEELQDLENFFELKVVSYPYKLNNMMSFLKIICAEQMILKDFIQIIRLELHNDPSHRWNVEWCLTVPPGDQRRKQLLGTPAVMAENNKVLFFIQLTRSRSSGNEDNAIIVPIFLPPDNGTTPSQVTSLDNIPNDSSIKLSPHIEAVISHLKTWSETTHRLPGTCPLYPAVLSLLKSLVVPE